MKLKVTKSEHPSFKKGDVVEARKPQWLDNKYIIISEVGSWTFFANRSGNRFSIGGKFGDPIVNLVLVKPELSDYEKANRRDMWIEIGVVAVASIILLVAGFMK